MFRLMGALISSDKITHRPIILAGNIVHTLRGRSIQAGGEKGTDCSKQVHVSACGAVGKVHMSACGVVQVRPPADMSAFSTPPPGLN